MQHFVLKTNKQNDITQHTTIWYSAICLSWTFTHTVGELSFQFFSSSSATFSCYIDSEYRNFHGCVSHEKPGDFEAIFFFTFFHSPSVSYPRVCYL